MRQAPIVKVTRIKLDGTKTVEVKRLGQENGMEVSSEQTRVVTPSQTVINIPQQPPRVEDASAVSKSPFQKPVTRIQSTAKLIEERNKEFEERSPYFTDVQIDEMTVPARLMSTKITEDGKPDTLVTECPICHNRIEAGVESINDLSCSNCGFGSPGKIMTEQMTIVEPISHGLMDWTDFGFDFDHPLQVVFKDD